MYYTEYADVCQYINIKFYKIVKKGRMMKSLDFV